MRVESAATAKGRSPSTHIAPEEGTVLRSLWEQFKAAPAEPIRPKSYENRASLGSGLDQLRNFYGMDIRVFHEKRTHDGKGAGIKRYWLVGEWFGKTYVDYVADRRAQEERAARRSA